MEKKETKEEKKERKKEEIYQLILVICKNDEEFARCARDALVQSADRYESSRPIVGADGRRSKPLIADDRKALRNLQRKLEAARAVAQRVSIGALSMFCNAYDNPMGRLLNELDAGATAAQRAAEAAQAQPDRPSNFERKILAYEVACVFRDILKKKPTATRDTAENINTKRGGAAYARVLRATLELAGVANPDLGPLIDAGLRRLSDKALPQRAND